MNRGTAMNFLDFIPPIFFALPIFFFLAVIFYSITAKEYDLSLLPAMVTNQLRDLGDERHAEFLEEYKRRCKRIWLAYLLFGFHYAYVGKWGIQVLYWFTFGGGFIWTLIDLFRIPSIVRGYNHDVAIAVLKDLRSVE